MANYDNNNSGSLFINDRKESDRHPDFKGSAEVDGVEYWVSMWKKVSKDGSRKYFSLSFQPKEKAAAQATGDMPDFGGDLDL